MPGPASLPAPYRNVLGLRVVRHFENRPLSDPDLHAILEAARWTGTSKNRQAWSIVVITDPNQKDRIAECGDFTDPVRRAPLAMALVQEDLGYEFDMGRVAQNIMLASNALEVGSCPVTFHRSDDAGKLLGIGDGAHCRYGIALGYPASNASPARMGGRKPLDEFVHWDRY
ncbi:MAG: nitroreductase family protein [Acidimicrobiia bacterium]